jgi:hypothetical protein
MMAPKIVQLAVGELVSLISKRLFEEAVQKCSLSRLTATDIKSVIDNYGRTLKCPPVCADQLYDIVEVHGRSNHTWSVRAPLWTNEEGRSDLTLDLTIYIISNVVNIEFDDLRVL